MKNDVKKLEKITDEMKVNDMVFSFIVAEYSKLEKAIDFGNYYQIEDELDKAYFYRRVISVLDSNDLPLAAAGRRRPARPSHRPAESRTARRRQAPLLRRRHRL